MTISSQNRKAGPFLGNGSTTSFPFTFKVFAASDLQVVRANSSGVESVLVLNSDYTVTLNANQNSNPGGSVTLSAALAVGSTMVITSVIGYLQPMDLTNQGGFYPKVINDSLDRVTMLTQQLKEQVDRSAKLPITSPADANALVADIVRIADSADNIDTVAQNIDAVNDAYQNATDAAASASLANDWATKTSAPVAGGEYSAKYNAQQAASSASSASSSATSASTSASNASSSATSAAGSASSASTSATNAAASASTASTKATEASTSATNAAASASTASGAATTATTKASEASTSATNAASSATAAGTSATNAASSATSAAGSATTATTKASEASASATSAATSATTATTKAGEASTSATNAANSATAAASSASSASSSATSAGTSATTATTKASEASTSATNAANSASAAATSATNAAASASTATTKASEASASAASAIRYIGPAAANPTTRADGSAVQAGDTYFNTVAVTMRVYNGTTWQDQAASPDTMTERTFLATAGQTSYTFTGGYRVGVTYVWVNGVLLYSNDYTATDGTTITFASPLALNDEVRIISFKAVGSIVVADVAGLQAALDAKQATLVSGGNIKTLGGASLLGSGDVPLPSPMPEFVASGTIASAGLAVSLRSDGKVEVTSGASYSASVGTAVSPTAGTWTEEQASVYDPVTGNFILAYYNINSNRGEVVVGSVSGSTITFGSVFTFFSGAVVNLNINYDTANSKFVLVWKTTSNYLRLVVGTVSGTSVSFGSVTSQNDPLNSVRSTYDPVSGLIVVCASNPNVSDTGNVYLAQVSGTSISIVGYNNIGTNVDQKGIVSDVGNQKILIFFTDTSNSNKGTVVVGTISGTSISFSSRYVFDNATSSNFFPTYIPQLGATVVCYSGKVLLCTLSAGVPSFGGASVFASGGAEFASAQYHVGIGKVFIAYRDNATSGYGKYVTASVSGSILKLDAAVTIEPSTFLFVTALYHPASSKFIVSYRNESLTYQCFSAAVQIAGTATNAQSFIGFAQSAAANGATLKVATEASVDANQTGLLANTKYYVNFDGTLTATPTAYPLAGTALSSTRIQVATAPDYAANTSPAGSWVYIGTVTASATSTADLEGIDASYDTYVIVGQNINSTGTHGFYCRMKIGGAWQTTGYSYANLRVNTGSTSVTVSQSSAPGDIYIGNVEASSSNGAVLVMYVPGVASARNKIVKYEFSLSRSNDVNFHAGTGLKQSSSGALSGIRFYTDGSITGTFRLYGIKNS